MDKHSAFIAAAFSTEEAARLQEAARILAERTALSLEEAAGKILQALQALRDGIQSAFDKLTATFEEIAEELEVLNIEPRARRRKHDRDRARTIEQRYRAEIRRAESERIYRRVYKPP